MGSNGCLGHVRLDLALPLRCILQVDASLLLQLVAVQSFLHSWTVAHCGTCLGQSS